MHGGDATGDARVALARGRAPRRQALALVSPRDGSGVAAPAATYTLSDAASVLATLYVPWGREPEGLALRSEHGATPLSFFLQVRLYD